MIAHRWTAAGLAAVLVISACGGDDDDGADDAADGDTQQDASSGGASDDNDDDNGDDATDDGGAAGSGAVVIGEPAVTAEPGTAWAEVGGERFEYVAAESINVECTITDELVTVNFQTPEGHDFLVQGSPQTGDWFLNMTFAPGGNNDRYGSDSMTGGGTFTIGDDTLSYEGVVSHVVDFDVANAEDVDATVAANCA